MVRAFVLAGALVGHAFRHHWPLDCPRPGGRRSHQSDTPTPAKVRAIQKEVATTLGVIHVPLNEQVDALGTYLSC